MSISIEDRLFSIAPDIFGLRLPMAPPLEWVNVYFMRHENGWFLVDTGYNDAESRAIMEHAIAHHLDGLPIVGVLLTHYHSDHAGQAGWICERYQCPLYMSPTEWRTARWLTTDNTDSYKTLLREYYIGTGAPAELAEAVYSRGNGVLRACAEIPPTYKRLVQDQTIRIGTRNWRVHIGRGHAPEMIMLHDEEGKLLLSADQVVARITPNVRVLPFDPDANPLAEFLHTSATLPNDIPNDVMILPGHGRPFDDFHSRLAGYLRFCETRLNKFRSGLTGEPQSLYEMTKTIFVRDLTPYDFVFAIGETHAYVNYLVARGEMEAVPDMPYRFRKI